MRKIKIYVGCVLSEAPQEFQESVEALKENLRKEDFDVLDFAWINGAPNDSVDNIYEYDMRNVSDCDVLVALVDFPSLGLGMELERAYQESKNILAFAHQGKRISRMIVDLLRHYTDTPLLAYAHMDDIPEMVTKRLWELGVFSDGPLFQSAL